uniref:Uncharacterized protein n=1 Tax=Ananas comosus var. bracteatus TaxID=296719 RepID=A0A6V7NXN9_ANACO|nr:unnamed protein product [Ananas comosus var. bracteatus]
MQGQGFKANLRVIRLDGSSMVLGIDWLKSYGKVTFDFQQNSITIIKESQPLVLKGISEGTKLKVITARQWYQEFQLGECCILSQSPVLTKGEVEQELLPKLRGILEQYSRYF